MEDRRDVLKDDFVPESIGTQNEKSFHHRIKQALCPDETCQEFPIGRFIADIYRDGHIWEIQTGSFRSLRKKLTQLLPNYPITIVYPLAKRTTISILDENGILQPPRRSPKVGNPISIGKELHAIKEFLAHPNLDILIYYSDLREYRSKSAVPAGRKPFVRIDRYPQGEPTLIPLKTKEDYAKLLPIVLPDPFTVKEFAKAAKMSQGLAQMVIAAYRSLEVIFYVGKTGRAYLYSLHSKEKERL
jgi:hypothetical protein